EEIKKNAVRESLRENKALLELCLKLVTIKTDCVLPVGPKDARRKEMYTPEAYELCRILDFKAFLSRFASRPEAEKTYAYRVITEAKAIREAFAAAAKQTRCAVLVYPLSNVEKLLALQWGTEESVIIHGENTQHYLLTEMVNELRRQCSVVTFRIRTLYPLLYGEIVSLPGAESKAETQMTFEDLLGSAAETEKTDEAASGAMAAENMTAKEGVQGLEDLLLAAYLLDPLKSDHQIADTAKTWLGELLPPYEQEFGKADLKTAFSEKKDAFYAMMAGEVSQLLPLYDVLMDELQNTGMEKLYREMELPLSYVLYRMEQEGIRADAAALKTYGGELQAQLDVLERKIYDAAGERFNINSPKQLAEILFEKMKLPGGKKTKTGYSTSAEVLEKLAPEVPFVRDILEYRTYAKLKSTYADGLAAYIAADGRIHTRFNQTITATGRLSSTEPNLQNIPMRTELGRKIRRVFTPKAGYIFADADYSQIELRILASLAGDMELIEAYKGGKDIHRITASKVFHVPFEEVTDLQRRNAKAVNFGIVYGISSFGLSQDLSISRQEAKEYIEQYFATYPGIKAYLEKVKSEAKEKGYSVTAFGRRRPIPELKSSNFMQRQFGERVAMNAPIQGTAADVMKIAMLRVYDRLVKEGLRARLLLQIHDELLIEACAGEEAAVLAVLREEMQGAAEFPVALEVDAHTGTDWYEAK
ncbi:MAG: DNA polymerase I, partial [Lachnospiraceae bacterium]|nr:DNA polymerase I [Lachnospiraceae bacterium]